MPLVQQPLDASATTLPPSRFQMLRTDGCVYGIPSSLNADELVASGRLCGHPGVFSAPTVEELERLIDEIETLPEPPVAVAQCEGHTIFRYRDWFYGVPVAAGTVELELTEDRQRAGVVEGASRAEVEERIRSVLETTPVEFAGWLPIYDLSGNCGKHPQFTHASKPPQGYRFTCSDESKRGQPSMWKRLALGLGKRLAPLGKKLWAVTRPFLSLLRGGPRVGMRVRLRTLGALVRMYRMLRRRGAGRWAILRFLQTRHFQSQLMIGNYRGLVFLPSMPYTYNQNPWVIEIEDPTTLFYPLIQNGHTSRMPVHESPYFPIIKALLESDECKGILTHMRSTAEMVPALFGSDKIRDKVIYQPLGVKLPRRFQRHEARSEAEPIDLLFINSWCQAPGNFVLRGGLEILKAFDILRVRYPQLRLTMRSNFPDLDPRYHRILESGWVRVINRFLTAEEMADLHADSDIFLLPSARVHIVSLLQAMSYGLAVVASDGWGIEEYIEDGRNGLIVRGRYGKVSWADSEAGMLRENYHLMTEADPVIVEGLVESISRLVEDRMLRARLGRAARSDVETKYTLEQWNHGLKRVLDRAHAVGGN